MALLFYFALLATWGLSLFICKMEKYLRLRTRGNETRELHIVVCDADEAFTLRCMSLHNF